MRIGIMGGTFNPVHNAHLLIAELAREEFKLDRIIFITGGNPPHKNSEVSAVHRFNMTHIAIEGNESFVDDDFEINRTEKSYTVNTLEYLRGKYPCDELFFIIGEDSLEDLPKWYEPQRILDMCTLLVFPRRSHETLAVTLKAMREKFGNNILPISAPIMELSSTDIRNRIRDNKTVKYMIPDKVIEYIKQHNLYGDPDEK
ncbi:MAG: nicotinate-nucleotide adenylyltransferase [Hominilimicola sp.]